MIKTDSMLDLRKGSTARGAENLQESRKGKYGHEGNNPEPPEPNRQAPENRSKGSTAGEERNSRVQKDRGGRVPEENEGGGAGSQGLCVQGALRRSQEGNGRQCKAAGDTDHAEPKPRGCSWKAQICGNPPEKDEAGKGPGRRGVAYQQARNEKAKDEARQRAGEIHGSSRRSQIEKSRACFPGTLIRRIRSKGLDLIRVACGLLMKKKIKGPFKKSASQTKFPAPIEIQKRARKVSPEIQSGKKRNPQVEIQSSGP